MLSAVKRWGDELPPFLYAIGFLVLADRHGWITGSVIAAAGIFVWTLAMLAWGLTQAVRYDVDEWHEEAASRREAVVMLRRAIDETGVAGLSREEYGYLDRDEAPYVSWDMLVAMRAAARELDR